MRKKKLFKGKNFSVSLYELNIEGRKIKQEIIEQRGAAAILAFEGNKVIMIKQFRYPHNYVLEIPAGIIEKGETSKKCAYRELREETGYVAKKLTPLITYYPFLGYNLQYIDCYVASNLKQLKRLRLDKEEFISVVKIDFKNLLKMIKSGKIIDSKTICASLIYAIRKKIT